MSIETHMAAQYATKPVPAARDKAARYLMFALSVATLGAFANATVEFGSLPPDRLIVGTWQMWALRSLPVCLPCSQSGHGACRGCGS